jgi:acid phosphatase (class A)
VSGRTITLLAGGIAGVAAIAGAALSQPAAAPVAPARVSMLARGYLPQGTVPDSLKLNPPPPAPRSGALRRDEEAQRAALALQGTPRFALAALDADLASPAAAGLYSCAAGIALGPDTTPKAFALLRRTGGDLGFSVYPTKRKYMRKRPFLVNKRPTCTPNDEPMLARDGSYPSGHSAIGYGWGLILAELVPARSAELAARGRAFGDSRRVCNVHWRSDVEEGGMVAMAVVARLHAEPEFRADLEAARAELAAPRAVPDAVACAREAAVLAGG